MGDKGPKLGQEETWKGDINGRGREYSAEKTQKDQEKAGSGTGTRKGGKIRDEDSWWDDIKGKG